MEENIKLKTALLAKEKGFREVTRRWIELFGDNNLFEPISPADYNDESVFVKVVSAPTQSQLQAWILERYKINILIPFLVNKFEININFVDKEGLTEHLDGQFDNLEDALETALYEILKTK